MKWAKCNVGAKTETDYGSYFMWGSTRPNKPYECIWTYTPFNNGVGSYNETYFNSVKDIVAPNGVLAKEYDAAAQIMGGDWRMPTKDEIQELLDNTTSVWVTNYNGSGKNGRKFTSTINGNSIFIPAAGDYLDDSEFDVGDRGYVRSSSLNTEDLRGAWGLHFRSDVCYVRNDGRYDGLCVRGVL